MDGEVKTHCLTTNQTDLERPRVRHDMKQSHLVRYRLAPPLAPVHLHKFKGLKS